MLDCLICVYLPSSSLSYLTSTSSYTLTRIFQHENRLCMLMSVVHLEKSVFWQGLVCCFKISFVFVTSPIYDFSSPLRRSSSSKSGQTLPWMRRIPCQFHTLCCKVEMWKGPSGLYLIWSSDQQTNQSSSAHPCVYLSSFFVIVQVTESGWNYPLH